MALRRDISRIWHWLRPEAATYAAGIAALKGVNIFDVIAPLFMAVAVDMAEASITGRDPTTPALLRWLGVDAASLSLITAILIFLGLHLATNLLRLPMLLWSAIPSHRIGQNFRNAFTGHLFALSRPYLDKAKSGDLMSIATADINAIRMMYGPGVLVGLDTFSVLSLVLTVMFSLSWSLTLVALIPLPLVALITNFLSHREYKRFAKVQADLAEMTEFVRERYAGIRILQGYARLDQTIEAFADTSENHYELNIHLAKIKALFEPTLDLMLGLSTVLVVLVGGWQVLEGQLSVGSFVAFLVLVGYLTGPMIGFGWAVSLFQRGRASLTRIYDFLETPIDIPDGEDEWPDGPLDLKVEGLTFSYGAPAEASEVTYALKDVSFRLATGKSLGIMGGVGSGKSTIAHILTRLYDPPAGSVTVQGKDIREIKSSSLRSHIVLAPQDTFLFSDTVTRNILLATDDPDAIDTARSVATTAALSEDIEAFEDGYDTFLGERGVNLSGGQRQRLAIARALAANPTLLILDDCLSAVDAGTEARILSALAESEVVHASIIISHRIKALQACDEIIVLDQGRVVERGDHATLLALNGRYARIASLQSDGEEA